MRRVLLLLVCLFVGYTALVYQQGDGDPIHNAPPYTENVAAGATLYRAYNCQSCHQFYGLGGYMGPDLTNAARFKGKAYLAAFIKNGSQRMPDFHFNDTEVGQLTEYLTWIDATGLSTPSARSVQWTGSYQITDR